ncbi:MAG: hypothetical protein SXV54_06975 [Chloroflexota bacterium]|nr:hypothetical protein [Chloroflexota bacterium]
MRETKKKNRQIWLVILGWVASTLACNAPTPAPRTTSPVVTADISSTLSPQKTATHSPTEASPEATITPTSQTITETLTPTEGKPTPTVRPTPTPAISTGPLDFPVPAALDHWETLPNGENEATIILHITGGAPPYTIYHDQGLVSVTWKTNPAIIFQARGCSALVHTITVKSADGQSVQHDYWIPVPWCD